LALLFFEGPDRIPFLGRFSVLLGLSVLIAAFGLASDSAAVVIGAMLISPLTTPLLGLCTSLVLGWPRRQLESAGILVVATAAGIGLAWLVMAAVPDSEAATSTSTELLSRTAPQILDLAIAIAAGAAGAYVLVRREAIGALPGVAIAVALVPPLATVGITLQLGEPGLAGEALLLYVTNVAGIVLAGSLVLMVLGIQPEKVAGRLPRRTRIGIAAALLATLALVFPLQHSTRQAIDRADDIDDSKRIAQAWATGMDLELKSVSIRDEIVDVDVAGASPPDEIETLAQRLARDFGHSVKVDVHWTRQLDLKATADPDGQSSSTSVPPPRNAEPPPAPGSVVEPAG
jgi:uncharacterized hydrophobic protein (TIGR00271 family)